MNGSWYFILPKKNLIEYIENKLNFYSTSLFFSYLNIHTQSNYLGKMATILTSLQKVITGVGPGYRDFILLRGRKCILEPQKKFVQAKVSLPYFIKQKLYSYFKTATRLRVRNKGKARLEQRMPILRIRSKNLNNMKQ